VKDPKDDEIKKKKYVFLIRNIDDDYGNNINNVFKVATNLYRLNDLDKRGESDLINEYITGLDNILKEEGDNLGLDKNHLTLGGKNRKTHKRRKNRNRRIYTQLTLSQKKNPHLFSGSTKCNGHSINDVICSSKGLKNSKLNRYKSRKSKQIRNK